MTATAERPALTPEHLNIPAAVARRLMGGGRARRDPNLLDECVSAGYMALVDACRTYDPTAVGKGGKPVKLITHLFNAVRWKVKECLWRSRTRDQRFWKEVVRLEDIKVPDRDDEYPDAPPETWQPEAPEPYGCSASDAALAEHALSLVRPSDREVLRMRYELGMTLGQVGGQVGLSKERVRQLECRALASIRKVLCPDSPLAAEDRRRAEVRRAGQRRRGARSWEREKERRRSGGK